MKTTTSKTTSVSLSRFALALTAGAALGIGNAWATAPVNDDFANAIELTGDSGTLSGNTTVGATFQTGEPQCCYDTTTNTVWFKWICTTSGNFTLSTTGSTNSDPSEWDAVVGVYTGTTLDDLALDPDLAMNPQDTGLDETVTFPATSGTTYYFQLGGDSGGPPGQDAVNIVLTWSLVVPPPPTVVDISNATTPWEPSHPDAGVHINDVVGVGNTGRLIGTTQTHWSSGGFSVPLDLNGNSFIIDSGGGNPCSATGTISGTGSVRVNAGGVGTVIIGGSTGNTYSGPTVLNNGPINLSKSSGNALNGPITVQGSMSDNFPGTANVVWTRSDQVSDSSDMTLTDTATLSLAGHSDTINDLYLVTGSSVHTGAGGVLKVARLFINGTQQPEVAYVAGDGYVTGSGYIEVGASGPPVISSPPDTPANPVPANGSTTAHPAMVTLLDWGDCPRAASYDVYLWLASDPAPVIGSDPPNDNVSLSEYTLPASLASLTAYKWRVVAKNVAGNTVGPVWSFTTVSRQDISNATTYAEALYPDAGVRIDDIVGVGNTGRLVGTTQTHWTSGGFSVDLNLNGNTLIVDSGGGNPCSATGQIFGNGAVNVGAGGVGWIYFGGSTANTYTGTSVLNNGPIGLATAGNSLCGTITVQGTMSDAFPDTGNLVWLANNQISDDSDVSVITSGGVLNLNGYTDTIHNLSLVTGASVETGAGGVLTVSNLTVNGAVKSAGTYTSSSSFVTGSGSIVVLPAGSPYEIWASTHAGGQSASEDFNNDGVSNGLAYFMGAAGTVAATTPPIIAGTVTWPRDPTATITSWKVQVSTNLTTWTDVIPPDASIDTSDPTKVVYTLPSGTKQFCRLVVVP